MFNDSDLVRYRAFSRLVDKLDWVIKGEAVMQTALLKQWFMELEGKIAQDIQKSKAPPTPMSQPKPPTTKKLTKEKKK